MACDLFQPSDTRCIEVRGGRFPLSVGAFGGRVFVLQVVPGLGATGHGSQEPDIPQRVQGEGRACRNSMHDL